MRSEFPVDTHPTELYEKADFSGLLMGHKERFGRLTAFLERNSLENCFDHGDGGAAFDARVAELDLPPSIEVWDGSDDGALGYRFARLREQLQQIRTTADRRIAALTKQDRELRTQLSALAKRHDELEEQLATMRKHLSATQKRVSGIDKRAMVRIGPAIRRRVRRITPSGS